MMFLVFLLRIGKELLGICDGDSKAVAVAVAVVVVVVVAAAVVVVVVVVVVVMVVVVVVVVGVVAAAAASRHHGSGNCSISGNVLTRDMQPCVTSLPAQRALASQPPIHAVISHSLDILAKPLHILVQPLSASYVVSRAPIFCKH